MSGADKDDSGDAMHDASTTTEGGSASQTTRMAYDEILRAAANAVPRVVVVDGAHLGSLYEVHTMPVTIGRDPGNSMVLDEIGVSRRHAVIQRVGEQVILRDLGSKNGTFVNDERVVERVLHDGDILHLGATTLKFLASDNVEHNYYEYLRDISVQDPLTRIPNRRYLDEYMVREIARTRRYGRALTLLMIDVDHFKRVNDTHGHVCGDAVLRDLAQVISNRLRQSEFLARYGGEEFAILLPEPAGEAAFGLAERTRREVEALGIPHAASAASPVVTVSIGWASRIPRQGTDPDALIAAADEALYRAKKERNAVAGSAEKETAGEDTAGDEER